MESELCCELFAGDARWQKYRRVIATALTTNGCDETVEHL